MGGFHCNGHVVRMQCKNMAVQKHGDGDCNEPPDPNTRRTWLVTCVCVCVCPSPGDGVMSVLLRLVDGSIVAACGPWVGSSAWLGGWY